MRRAVYNSGIPDNRLKSVHRSALGLRALRFAAFLSTLVISLTALAADWSVPEQQLARKIAAVTGPGTVALTIENHSSLSRRDSEVVQNGLRAALEQSGLHFVKAEQAVASVTITLSENVTSYVWVAQIHQSATESAVAMVAIPRSGRVSAARDTMPITLRKTFLWSQNDPILDVAILEENGRRHASRCSILKMSRSIAGRVESGRPNKSLQSLMRDRGLRTFAEGWS